MNATIESLSEIQKRINDEADKEGLHSGMQAGLRAAARLVAEEILNQQACEIVDNMTDDQITQFISGKTNRPYGCKCQTLSHRVLERELAEEKYQHHITQGVADLAIKHREVAESENARLQGLLLKIVEAGEKLKKELVIECHKIGYNPHEIDEWDAAATAKEAQP